ncbi:hypothetical protein [Enteractinococcus helveticum]|uniref:Uncharacterized protein n=1 Tax=Enteractinococcus helveticum TaxID=1837282 RepID=A0A1B7M324_9MICC|nr:hypothetical protein [Enteractinococcus helveticum]OAV62939.1 hypothetical protein A6F49_03830 [Enteractinococcus helveticum]
MAELDRELKVQAERIKTQRKLLAELRSATTRYSRLSLAKRSTATQQLDQDVWTLITATGTVDANIAATIQNVLNEGPLADLASTWYPEFEQLETQTHIDDGRANELAGQIASFVDAVLEATGLTPATEQLPIMALVEQIRSDILSPAQHKVWSRFLSNIEQN